MAIGSTSFECRVFRQMGPAIHVCAKESRFVFAQRSLSMNVLNVSQGLSVLRLVSGVPLQSVDTCHADSAEDTNTSHNYQQEDPLVLREPEYTFRCRRWAGSRKSDVVVALTSVIESSE